MGMRYCRAQKFISMFLITLSFSCSASAQTGTDSSGCLQQSCGDIHVSYPFALADRSDCPAFSDFFRLTCHPSTHLLFLPNISSTVNSSVSYDLVVKHISTDSLIVDVTPLNASFPPLVPNASICSVNKSIYYESGFQLPPSPGPFFISDENEFASFGCTYSILLTTKLLPTSPPQVQIGPPAEAPAPAPISDGDYTGFGNVTDVEVCACATICPGDEGNSSKCGVGHTCCVTPLPQNSASRYADYGVEQSPFASDMSCKGGTNYATLFHRSYSDLNSGNYYVKLMWALPSNYTNNPRELSQSPEYACSKLNANSTIVDGVPGYLCSCNAGYNGDGYEKGQGCHDIDECDPANSNDCVSTSKCENLPPGNYTCRCNAWFHVGDGRKSGSGCKFSSRLRLAIEIGAVLGFVALMVGGSVCFAIWWRRRTKEKYFKQHGGLELQHILQSRSGRVTRLFKVEELKLATDNYADHMKLGAGGFGTVYKGVLKDETMVAVKRSNVRKGSDEGNKEQFLNEMAILVPINHRHIVRLLGCCLETAVPLLVYEFISNGNLEQNLRGNTGTVVMGWQQRIEVARQTAEALAYLHGAASPPILHRDVKSANVLLDDNFDAKVADFGLSRLVLDKDKEASAAIQGGTMGYLDPEYFQTFELTDKSDVYSLGVVLVELISGLKPVDSRKPQPSLALRFIHHMEAGKLEELIDARLAHNLSDHVTLSSIMAVAALARSCLHLHGLRRPSMSSVVDTLRHIVQSMRYGHDKVDVEDENAALLSLKDKAEYSLNLGGPHSLSKIASGSGSIHNALLNHPTSPR